jgi:hypothetical protein
MRVDDSIKDKFKNNNSELTRIIKDKLGKKNGQEEKDIDLKIIKPNLTKKIIKL